MAYTSLYVSFIQSNRLEFNLLVSRLLKSCAIFTCLSVLGAMFIAFAEPLKVIAPPIQSEKGFYGSEIIELLQTALEKTKASDGAYILSMSEHDYMNHKRYRHELAIGTGLINIAWFTGGQDREELRPIPVPLLNGLLGIRILLINKVDQKKYASIQSLEELKKLTAGQGESWMDVDILQANGIPVKTGVDYHSLLRMLTHKRFDYFPRGANEVLREYRSNKAEYPDLMIEPTIALYYPYPFYFYVHKSNEKLAKRLEKGLKIMIDDGSHEAIFRKHNQKNIELLHLEKRRVFELSNPFLPKGALLNHDKFRHRSYSSEQP